MSHHWPRHSVLPGALENLFILVQGLNSSGISKALQVGGRAGHFWAPSSWGLRFQVRLGIVYLSSQPWDTLGFPFSLSSLYDCQKKAQFFYYFMFSRSVGDFRAKVVFSFDLTSLESHLSDFGPVIPQYLVISLMFLWKNNYCYYYKYFVQLFCLSSIGCGSEVFRL